MKSKLFSLASCFAAFVLIVAQAAGGTASIWGAHQPEEPSSLKQ